MNRTVMSTLIVGLLGGSLTACGGGGDTPASSKMLADTVTNAAVACFTPWNSSTVYNAGGQASYNNVNYNANWWTQGNNPSTSNGGVGTGQPWTSVGECGTGTPTPTPTPTQIGRAHV